MSNLVLNWAFKQAIKGARKAVLIALANRANEKDFIYFPGVTKLAFDAGYSRSTVIKCIKDLERMGLIGKKYKYNQRGKMSGIVYRLNIDLSPELLGSNLLPGNSKRLSPSLVSTKSEGQTQTINEPLIKKKANNLNSLDDAHREELINILRPELRPKRYKQKNFKGVGNG